MSDDIRKLEEAILALSPTQKEMLLRKLIEAIDTNINSTTGQYRVADSQSIYSGNFKSFSGEEEVSRLLSISNDPTRENGGVMDQLDRITQTPGMMGGKACIRGMRVTVSMIVGQIGAGASIEEVLADYPYLERDDILQALRYAAWRAEEREVMLGSA